MNKINIDNISQQNGEIPVINLDNRNKVTKLLQKYALFIVLWVLFWISLYAYSLSISNENKAVIKIKEQIQNIDSANNEDLKQIKLRQDNINKRLEIRVKLKEQLEKIVNRYNPLSLIFTKTYAEETEKHTLDIKIEKFCKQYWEEKGLQDYISKCAKLGKAMMRFETGWICKNKDHNRNCFNFRAISKKNREWFDIRWVDKSWFTIFWDKTNSIKYFAYRFYKYDYRKTTEQIVWGGCYKNLQGKWVCFNWFTHSSGDHNNYISFINNFKD